MLNLILSIIIVILTIHGQGMLFNRIVNFEKNYYKNFNETFIFGIIFLSFNVLLINFFLPINKIISTIFLATSLFYFFYNIYFSRFKKKYLKKIFILTIITFFLLAFSTINRPDAGLYHLPYISIINENKIIFGVTNLHFRFGHISIVQYLSSIFNSFILHKEAITIPLALIFSSIIIFIFESLKKQLKKDQFYLSIILFFFLIFSIYSYNRYSEYGNDAPSHLFFQLFIIYITLQNKIDINFFGKILLLSVYLFSIKPFMIVISLVVIYLFFKINKKKTFLLNGKLIFSLIFLILWIIKNIITSGCLIYPITKSCISKITYLDLDKTKVEEIAGEAWSKDWINYKDKEFDIDSYNKKFRWVSTWSDNHLKVVIEKFGPFFLFLLIFNFIFYLNRDKNENINKHLSSINNHIFLFFILLMTLIWFIKFPLYRFGSSILATFFIFATCNIIKKYSFFSKKKIIKKIINSTVIFAIILFSLKNFNRIFVNINKDTIWPQIYSLKNDLIKSPIKFEKIILNNNGHYFYSHGELCMYSKSPCTHIKLEDIHYSKKLNYFKMFYKN